MARFILRRLLQAIPTFFGITIISYAIMVLAPGDPVSIMTFDPSVSAERRAEMEKRLGVNDPLPLQYLRWLAGDDWIKVEELTWYQVRLEDGSEGWLSENMVAQDEETGELNLLATRQPYRDAPAEAAEIIGRVGRNDAMELVTTEVQNVYGDKKGILRGDFGSSFVYKQNPLGLIMERLPASIELNIAVIFVSVIIGVVVGVLAAIWRGGWFDQITRVLSVIGDAVPSFWLSFLFILFFAVYLDILPLGGRCEPVRGACPPIYQRLEYLVLPATVLAFGGVSFWSRYIRASMLENINSDYVRTAKAKGLPARAVWFRHALRNALIPIATFLGPTIVGVISGAVIIEQIFAWPGIGRLLLQAVSSQDYPMVMASVVIAAILTIIGYLISDVLYVVFDPRIRL